MKKWTVLAWPFQGSIRALPSKTVMQADFNALSYCA